jgi:acyl-CoA reductase-like NAD-dependent aldehyde dehydrogenase
MTSSDFSLKGDDPVAEAKSWLSQRRLLLIDGKHVVSQTDRWMDVLNPATGALLARVAQAGAEDIDLAVDAARRSFESRAWRGMPVDQRVKIIWRFSELMEAHAGELAYLQTSENGMPLAVATRSVLGAAGWMRSFAGLPKRLGGRAYGESISAPGEWHAYTRKEPVGVVGLITPWNGPISTLVIKLAPALVAGCSVVAKPSELTPLGCLRLAELALEAGLPPGVLNMVPGYGTDAGARLCAHEGVNKVSFTGSTAVGRELVRLSAGNLKRLTLELGGKSPCIVFDDADMDLAIPGAAMAIFANTGQACIAGSRLFVQRKSFDKVVSGIVDVARKLRMGDGMESGVDLGPLISEKQRQRVLDYVESGVSEGAEIATGGAAIDGKGYFVQPTVMVNTRPEMKMVREEIFGPVLCAMPFDDLDEIPALANSMEYGLAAGVYSRDVNKVHKLASRLEAGSVYVNCYSMFDAVMPFGGYKQSGWGRELGDEGLEAYLETKSVYMRLT